MGRKRKVPLCQEPDLPALPVITGQSEKQIDWAILIREHLLYELSQWIKWKLTPLPLQTISEAEQQYSCHLYTSLKKHLYTQTNAIWFIIRRWKSTLDLLQELHQQA